MKPVFDMDTFDSLVIRTVPNFIKLKKSVLSSQQLDRFLKLSTTIGFQGGKTDLEKCLRSMVSSTEIQKAIGRCL